MFWGYAFVTDVYLIRRLAMNSLDFVIPYFVLFDKNHDFRFLKTFGCSYFSLVRPYKSHELYFKSEERIFLGYSQLHKGYKCLSSSGHIFISKDALFDEL